MGDTTTAVGTERSFLFVVGSSRAGGNTEALARLAATGLPTHVRQCWLCLRDLDLPPFHDTAAPDEEPREPQGVERMSLEATLAATDLVIVTPLYWYSMSWPVKLYLDHWASWERLPGARFKEQMRGRTLWAVSIMADDDHAVADPLMKALELSAAYLGARFAGALREPAAGQETCCTTPVPWTGHDATSTTAARDEYRAIVTTPSRQLEVPS